MSQNTLAGRDCLRLLDLTPEEFTLVLDTAARQKADWKNGCLLYTSDAADE